MCRSRPELVFSGHWGGHYDSLVGALRTVGKSRPVHKEETKEPRACLRSQRACGRIRLAAQAAGIKQRLGALLQDFRLALEQPVETQATRRVSLGVGHCACRQATFRQQVSNLRYPVALEK